MDVESCSNKGTQTDVDCLYEHAEDIVKNFNKIETHWKRAERRNCLLIGGLTIVGIILGLRLVARWYGANV